MRIFLLHGYSVLGAMEKPSAANSLGISTGDHAEVSRSCFQKAEGGAAVNFHAPARLRTGVRTPLTDAGTGIRRGAVPLVPVEASEASLFRALALPKRPEF